MSTDFQNSFAGRLSGKFAPNSYLNIPAHLIYVARVQCLVSLTHGVDVCIVTSVFHSVSTDNLPPAVHVQKSVWCVCVCVCVCTCYKMAYLTSKNLCRIQITFRRRNKITLLTAERVYHVRLFTVTSEHIRLFTF